MRHTGYAAMSLGIGLYCWILPQIERGAYAWGGLLVWVGIWAWIWIDELQSTSSTDFGFRCWLSCVGCLKSTDSTYTPFT
jgi:hypothetical protein